MINFPFGTNGKSIIIGVPILKHITVILRYFLIFFNEVILTSTHKIYFNICSVHNTFREIFSYRRQTRT